ncbi:DUF4913 domain-containing protein [Curtobacterium sp. NPDC092190]|uniref:DUF4913 domain-containing protein n=2 Tax=unclassified Curtobacterium TaxID=257496 RepID=UPI0037F6849B
MSTTRTRCRRNRRRSTAPPTSSCASSWLSPTGGNRDDGATGMSVWWRDHADHHMGVLMSPAGPFGKSSGTTDPGEPLPYMAPPPGLFVDVRTIAN